MSRLAGFLRLSLASIWASLGMLKVVAYLRDGEVSWSIAIAFAELAIGCAL